MEQDNENRISYTQEQLDQALAEIDHIFNETMTKLNELHRRKMELIAYYSKKRDEEDLAKIRASINNQ